MESKRTELIETETRTVVTRGSEVGEMGRCWSKTTNFSVSGEGSSGDLMYSMVINVNKY